MMISILVIINLIAVGFSLTEGVREGFYWHYENNSRRVCEFDINPIFNLQRGLVALLTGGLLVHIIGWWSLLILICLLMIFPYFHNGTYYYTRNRLDGRSYPKRWTDESTSFPHFTPLMTYKKRTILLALGVMAQVFIYIFLL